MEQSSTSKIKLPNKELVGVKKSKEYLNHSQGKFKFSQLGSKGRKSWVRARWLAYLKKEKMRSEKTRKFKKR